jgi:hypothetical protein
MLDAALLVPLALPLPIGRNDLGVLLAALSLVVGMFVPPLPLAVAHNLAIEGVGLQFLAVIVSASLALTGRLAANHLLWPVRGRDKQTLAMRTAAGRAQTNSSELESLRRIETIGGKQDLETTV